MLKPSLGLALDTHTLAIPSDLATPLDTAAVAVGYSLAIGYDFDATSSAARLSAVVSAFFRWAVI